jgi:hypothetical protein
VGIGMMTKKIKIFLFAGILLMMASFTYAAPQVCGSPVDVWLATSFGSSFSKMTVSNFNVTGSNGIVAVLGNQVPASLTFTRPTTQAQYNPGFKAVSAGQCAAPSGNLTVSYTLTTNGTSSKSFSYPIQMQGGDLQISTPPYVTVGNAVCAFFAISKQFVSTSPNPVVFISCVANN